MSKRFCKKCKSTNVVEDGYYGGTTYYNCKTCHHLFRKDEFPEMTLFDRITESPEVLAPNFVYRITNFLDGLDKPKKIWYSTLINNQYFNTELEAKRATVAKLKEMAE